MAERAETEVFITRVDINEVWELRDIQIPLSETERKHLILTGKNGSGKTTLLNAIKESLRSFMEPAGGLWEPSNPSSVTLSFAHELFVVNLISEGTFILANFEAKRYSQMKPVSAIQKVTLKSIYSIDGPNTPNFLQYIVNLKAERSFAKDDGDDAAAERIDHWFDNFERFLRDIFDDSGLELVFDRKNYSFSLQYSNGTSSDLRHLSDGYSAIMSIISELILRMEAHRPVSYDMQGVVLIDEIETHLHVDLQKKILPFLTTFFPRIQFIVSTHSPFVINSVENAVVYDLERKIRVEDASGYSYDTIIESYFDSDKYSGPLKAKVAEYEELAAKGNPTEAEQVRLIELEEYFDNLPMELSPELEIKINQIRLARL